MLNACDLIPPSHRDGHDRPAFGADDLWVLSCILIWGGNAVASKILLLVLSPMVVFYLRTIGGALLFGVPVLLRYRRSLTRAPLPWLILVLGGLMLAAENLTFFWGLRLTTASETAVLSNTGPLWTALMVGGCGLEHLRRHHWIGLLLALGGIALLVFVAPHGPAEYTPAPVLGGFLALLSAIFFALYIVVTKGVVEQIGALTLLATSYAVGALVTLPGAVVALPQVAWGELRPLDWSMLAYSVLLAGVYAFLVYYWVIGRTSALRVAVYQYLVPVTAALAAFLFLHESLQPWQYVGLVITLLGVYLARPVRHDS